MTGVGLERNIPEGLRVKWGVGVGEGIAVHHGARGRLLTEQWATGLPGRGGLPSAIRSQPASQLSSRAPG